MEQPWTEEQTMWADQKTVRVQEMGEATETLGDWGLGQYAQTRNRKTS